LFFGQNVSASLSSKVRNFDFKLQSNRAIQVHGQGERIAEIGDMWVCLNYIKWPELNHSATLLCTWLCVREFASSGYICLAM